MENRRFWPFFGSASNANSNENCNENCHAVGTRFHYFPVIVGKPNLVSSFLTIFPRELFRNIPEKSNPPLRKNCRIFAIFTFIWSALGTINHYFPVIVRQPNLASSFLTSFPRVFFRNSSENSNPPSEKTVEILQF